MAIILDELIRRADELRARAAELRGYL